MRRPFDDALLSDDPYRALDELEKSGAFREHLPEIQRIVGFGGAKTGHKDLWDHTRRVIARCPRSLTVRWAALFHDVGKPDAFRHASKVTFHGHETRSTELFYGAAERTGFFRSAEIARIAMLLTFLARSGSYSAEWEDSAVKRLSRDVGAAWDDLIALTRADCTTGRPEKYALVQRLATELDDRRNALLALENRPPALPTGLGNALLDAYGRAPGAWLGALMRELTARVERGELPRNDAFDVYIEAAQSIEPV